MRRVPGLLLVIVALVVPSPGAAQGVRPLLSVGMSSSVPSDLRGRMTMSTPIGAATDVGAFAAAGLELPAAPLALRVEAVYSRRTSAAGTFLGHHGIEGVYAAEEEKTLGSVVSVLAPPLQARWVALRVSASLGVLRTQLRGHGTVGGDAAVAASSSSTAPAVGLGFEIALPVARHELLLGARAAQQVGPQRGGGYVVADLGVRW